MSMRQQIKEAYQPSPSGFNLNQCASEVMEFTKQYLIAKAKRGAVNTEEVWWFIKRKYVLLILDMETRKHSGWGPGYVYEPPSNILSSGGRPKVWCPSLRDWRKLGDELERRCNNEGLSFHVGTGDGFDEFFIKSYL